MVFDDDDGVFLLSEDESLSAVSTELAYLIRKHRWQSLFNFDTGSVLFRPKVRVSIFDSPPKVRVVGFVVRPPAESSSAVGAPVDK
jgi:hypothetical protein